MRKHAYIYLVAAAIALTADAQQHHGTLAQPLVLGTPAKADPSAALSQCTLGYYRFDGDGSDDCSRSGAFDLYQTEFVGDALYLNGRYEHGDAGYRAIADVPDLDYNSFTVSLEFKHLPPAENFLARIFNVGLEDTGNIITGGTSFRWLSLRTSKNNNLEVTLNNQDWTHIFEDVYVKTDVWNAVVCCVDLNNLTVRTFFNGEKLKDIRLPCDFALRIVSSERAPEDKKFTFTNYSDGRVLYGYVDNLRIFGRALNDREALSLKFSRPLGRRSYTQLLWTAAICSLALAAAAFYFYCKKTKRRAISKNT